MGEPGAANLAWSLAARIHGLALRTGISVDPASPGDHASLRVSDSNTASHRHLIRPNH